MLSILICHSYFLELDRKQRERSKPYPPLATLQVVELLRTAGHRVSFFDAMLAHGTDEYLRILERDKTDLVLFYEDTFNFLSKMCLGAMRRAACDMIRAARRRGSRIMVAGPDVTDSPGPYLDAGADVALTGEGLSALLAILPRLEANVDASAAALAHGLPGTVTTDPIADSACSSNTRSHARAITPSLPVAAWDLVDVDRYREVWMSAHGYFSLNMAASRGCSFRCSWCAKPTWGNHYIQRNPDEVAEEMAYLKRSFRPDHIWFADDIFGFKVEWVTQFAAAAERADGKIPFTIQTRADLITDGMAKALARAGCREVWLGAESGSQRILDAMNKGTTIAEIVTARQRLGRCGIRVGFFIQLGYLGEQLDDIVATRRLLHSANPDDIGVSVSYPLPGTKFYDAVKEQLGQKTHWRESNDLAMMFHGTFTSDFYRAVRNYLHDEVTARVSGAIADAATLTAFNSRWEALMLSAEQHYAAGDPAGVNRPHSNTLNLQEVMVGQ